MVSGNPIDELRQAKGGGWTSTVQRFVGAPAVGWALWLANLAALAWLVAWIACDGKFPAVAVALKSQLQALVDGAAVPGMAQDVGYRLILFWILSAVALLTLFGVFSTLLAGAATHRRLRSWFAYTMLVAAWLTVFVSWRELAWQGQRLRLRTHLVELEPIAASLRSNWPTHDGDGPKLGAFMAYPQGKPRMLLMLTPPETPGTTLSFSAVERDDDGALRFNLSGDDAGTWLEWHPAGSAPRAFTGGLEGQYDFGRAAPLGRGWYLVRYH
ncbi:MAG: hypothetical protein WD971_12745 [Pirellulales bacterium]